MKVTLATTCGGRLHHLRQTLPVMAEAAHDASDVFDVEIIVVDFGPTAGVEAFVGLFPGAVRVPVVAAQWNFGKARNAALNAATGDVFVNVDCDTFIDALSIETAADWLEQQGEKSYLCSAAARGRHGRLAFFTSELIALGGFNEADLDGAEHVMGADIADVYDRADAAGFSSRKWPGRFDVIEHGIDKPAARAAGWALRAKIIARRDERIRKGRKRNG